MFTKNLVQIDIWTKYGLLAILTSAAGYYLFPIGLKYGIKSQFNLSKDGLVFPMWIKPPFLTNSSFYLFEVENAEEALMGKKARVKKRGPYNFNTESLHRVANLKKNTEFSFDDQQLSLVSMRKFYFNPEGSLDLDERYNMLDPTLPTIQATVQTLLMNRLPFQRVASPLIYNAVNLLVDAYKIRLFPKRSPRQVLFGFKLEIMQDVQNVAARFGLSSLVPKGPPDNMFGLVYIQNNTEDSFVLHTGLGKNSERYGDVISWQGQRQMDVWKGKCNKILGNNGELHKPFPSQNEPIKVFLAPICRSTTLDPVRKVRSANGVDGIEFEFSKKLFQGVRSNRDNACYCTDESSPDCQYDGLVGIGPCFYSAPVFLSKANFKDTDYRLKSLVDGLVEEYPDKATFVLELNTGSIIEADTALMGSIKVIKTPYMRDLGSVQNLSFIPFFLAHEKVILPSEFTSPLSVIQTTMSHYGTVLMLCGAAGGAAMVYGRRRGTKGKVDENNETKDKDTSMKENTKKGDDLNSVKTNCEPTIIFNDSTKDIESDMSRQSSARLNHQSSRASTAATRSTAIFSISGDTANIEGLIF